MHYYKHNIADYRKDTSHLSLLEHGIYRQLLDSYYLSEKPLVNDAKLMRTHSVRSADERQSFQNVLEDFFLETEDGYIHVRCTLEITEYHEKSEKATLSAKARWAKGSDKKSKTSNANGMRTHSERNANHKPLTINHKEERPTFLQAEKIAHYLAKNILKENPKAKLKPDKWIKEIDRAIRIDDRTEKELVELINWIYAGGKGSFWIANIVSGNKLRQQFDQITAQMKEDVKVKVKKQMKLPAMDDQLESWAVKNGLPKPKAGQSYSEYRRLLSNNLESKLKKIN